MKFTKDQEFNIRTIIHKIFKYRHIYELKFDEYMSKPRPYVQFSVDEVIGDEMKELLYYFPTEKWETSFMGTKDNLVEIVIGEI